MHEEQRKKDCGLQRASDGNVRGAASGTAIYARFLASPSPHRRRKDEEKKRKENLNKKEEKRKEKRKKYKKLNRKNFKLIGMFINVKLNLYSIEVLKTSILQNSF